MDRTTSEVPPTLESVRALLRARQLEQAQKEAERLVGARADDAEARFLLGIVQAERRNFVEALVNIKYALIADENPPWTRQLALTSVLRDSGDARAAEMVARRLIEREPKRVQPQNALGLALHDQARFDEAVAAFREASALDPGYIAARLNLA